MAQKKSNGVAIAWGVLAVAACGLLIWISPHNDPFTFISHIINRAARYFGPSHGLSHQVSQLQNAITQNLIPNFANFKLA